MEGVRARVLSKRIITFPVSVGVGARGSPPMCVYLVS
jgi:hypothetical protein